MKRIFRRILIFPFSSSFCISLARNRDYNYNNLKLLFLYSFIPRGAGK